MQFNRPLGPPEFRPVVERQAQVDHGRIQADQFVLEAEFPVAGHLAPHRLQEAVEHVLKHRPGPMRIGVGERRPGGGRDAQVDELALATLEAPFNLPQRVGAPQLAKEHRHELAPARQAFAPVFRPGLLDDALKVRPGNELENLTKHAA